MLRTLFAANAVIADTLVMAGPIIGASLVSPQTADPFVRSWCRVALASCGVSVECEGLSNIDLSRRYVFVSNHQSHLDVPSILVSIPTTIRFVAKRSLFRIPVFGQAIRAMGNIDVDRTDAEDTRRRMQDAQRGIATKASVLFFAEGTRSDDGSLRPFKKGAAAMALSLGLPVVPVSVSGTNAVLPPGFHQIRPGKVLVRVGSPIEVGENTPDERRKLTAVLEEKVAALLGVPPPAARQ